LIWNPTKTLAKLKSLLSYYFRILNLIMLTYLYAPTVSILSINKRINTPSLIKRLRLLLLSLRLSLLKNCLTIRNYSLNSYFNLYSALLSSKWASFMLISLRNTCLNSLRNLGSYKQIVSLSGKLRNAILILMWLIFKSSFAAFASKIYRVIYYIINANVLK
jgi:hypothetical protein